MVSRAESPLGEGVSRIMCPGDSLEEPCAAARVRVVLVAPAHKCSSDLWGK